MDLITHLTHFLKMVNLSNTYNEQKIYFFILFITRKMYLFNDHILGCYKKLSQPDLKTNLQP